VESISYKASAPGNLILLGEHAIVYKKHALVCAVNKRITVTLIPRADTKIEIISRMLGNMTTDLTTLRVVSPFQFVLATVKYLQKKMQFGCTLIIESEFSDSIGLGSSASVTVATLAALTKWLHIPLTPLDMIRKARTIIFGVQGVGSGADVAACVLGGMVAYQRQPLRADKLPYHFPLTLVYSGYKTPTVTVIKKVKDFFSMHTTIFKKLCEAIDTCAVEGIALARKQKWKRLGEVMTVQQGLMEALGVNTPPLGEIVTFLRAQPTILGAKISGSGLGDCIVGLGSVTKLQFTDGKIKLISIEISVQGVKCEKI
jgi:mevalonate kinase